MLKLNSKVIEVSTGIEGTVIDFDEIDGIARYGVEWVDEKDCVWWYSNEDVGKKIDEHYGKRLTEQQGRLNKVKEDTTLIDGAIELLSKVTTRDTEEDISSLLKLYGSLLLEHKILESKLYGKGGTSNGRDY